MQFSSRVLAVMVVAAGLVSSGLCAIPLKTAKEIRALAPEVAAQGLPVEMNGVVTFANESAMTLFIHDGESGVFIELPPADPVLGRRQAIGFR